MFIQFCALSPSHGALEPPPTVGVWGHLKSYCWPISNPKLRVGSQAKPIVGRPTGAEPVAGSQFTAWAIGENGNTVGAPVITWPATAEAFTVVVNPAFVGVAA